MFLAVALLGLAPQDAHAREAISLDNVEWAVSCPDSMIAWPLRNGVLATSLREARQRCGRDAELATLSMDVAVVVPGRHAWNDSILGGSGSVASPGVMNLLASDAWVVPPEDGMGWRIEGVFAVPLQLDRAAGRVQLSLAPGTVGGAVAALREACPDVERSPCAAEMFIGVQGSRGTFTMELVP